VFHRSWSSGGSGHRLAHALGLGGCAQLMRRRDLHAWAGSAGVDPPDSCAGLVPCCDSDATVSHAAGLPDDCQGNFTRTFELNPQLALASQSGQEADLQ
jgi:hypothetical protein